MDRRKFSQLAAAACGAPLATLSACGGGEDAPADGMRHTEAVQAAVESATSPRLTLWHATPNPTGLRVGFWENFDQQDLTLSTMGRRPSSRVGFYRWSELEDDAGNYTHPSPDKYADAHRYGESILGAINICFAIPTGRGYANDISNPDTIEAAKRFLADHVTWLLSSFGSLVLTIDYEIVSNYLLTGDPDTPTDIPAVQKRALDWRNWYVNHAVPTARATAAAMGMSDKLKLQPIFNGNALSGTNPVAIDPVVIGALRDVVGASDYLALDTYFSDKLKDVTDPSRTIDTIAFWYTTYAKPNNKEVIVTENGFSTITEVYQDITRAQCDWKYVGTEAQQKAYFHALFPRLMKENASDGLFENKLRAFHVWSIIDNDQRELKDAARYLGLHRIAVPPIRKPAANVVGDALDTIQQDEFHRPFIPAEVDGTNLWSKLHKGLMPVDLRFTEGDDHDLLRYVDTGPGSHKTPILKVTLAIRGSLLLNVNGVWQFRPEPTPDPDGLFKFEIDLSGSYNMSGSNTIDLIAAGQVFPLQQQVKFIDLVYV